MAGNDDVPSIVCSPRARGGGGGGGGGERAAIPLVVHSLQKILNRFRCSRRNRTNEKDKNSRRDLAAVFEIDACAPVAMAIFQLIGPVRGATAMVSGLSAPIRCSTQILVTDIDIRPVQTDKPAKAV